MPRGSVEWGLFVNARGVEGGAFGGEEFDCVQEAVLGGVVEGGGAKGVGGFDVGAHVYVFAE